MPKLASVLATVVAAGVVIGTTAPRAQQAALKMTLFGQPSVNNDSIWMAIEKGFYRQEGLDVRSLQQYHAGYATEEAEAPRGN